MNHQALESSFFEELDWLDGSVRLPPVLGGVAECDSCSIPGEVDLLPKESNVDKTQRELDFKNTIIKSVKRYDPESQQVERR